MMWFVLQWLIMSAVLIANFYWQVTPSGYVVGLAGVLLAWAATHLVSWVIRRLNAS
jgi:hypothetical protein